MSANEPTRCSGCAKPITDGDGAMQMVDGTMKKGAFAKKKEWAMMHRSCFNRSIDSPTAVLDELRAEQAARSSGR